MKTTVAIVEDNGGICRELQHILAQTPDLECVCVCRNGATALRTIPALAPDVVIVDLQLPDISGIECTSLLRAKLLKTQVLVFTVHDDDERIRQALRAGAVGYLLKHADAVDIVAAVRSVKRGGSPLTSEIARKIVEQFRPPAREAQPIAQLTARENEVFDLLASGMPDKQIADVLGISTMTVNTHLKHIYQKLGVRTRTEAVARFRR